LGNNDFYQARKVGKAQHPDPEYIESRMLTAEKNTQAKTSSLDSCCAMVSAVEGWHILDSACMLDLLLV
jgi:hypothetical protein